MGWTIALDRGHVGGTGGRAGAEFGPLKEDRLTREYMAATEDALRDRGYEVIVYCDSTYKNRQLRAAAVGADVYVACHVNSGARNDVDLDFGAAFHDARSSNGAELGEHIRQELLHLPPLVATGGAVSMGVKASAERWQRNVLSTISLCYDRKPIGICYEPGFIDHAGHGALWTSEGLVQVGEALANGIASYLEQ